MKKYLKLLLLIVVVVAAFSLIQANVNEFLGVDAYYHAKTVLLILADNNLISGFPWLQYTILNENFVEHHLLLHVLLLPFFKLFSPFMAAKIAVIIFGTGFFISFLIILKKLRLKFPFFWTLLLIFSSSLFIFRLNLLRAQSLALIFLLIGVYLLIRKKYSYLILLSIFYTWLFDGFIILGIVVAIKSLVEFYYFLKKKQAKSIPDFIHPLLYYLLGVFIAIIINPYFPKNIYHLFFHLYQVSLKNPFSNLPIGNEWHFSAPSFLISSSLIIIILLVFSSFIIFLSLLKRREIGNNSLFFFFTALVFFLLTLISKRMIEYSAPLIILLAAYLYTKNYPAVKYYHAKILSFKKPWIAKILIVFLLLSAAIYNFQAAYFNLNNDEENKINTKKAGIWMKENLPPNEIVYHLDWSESPQLLFYNDQNYYIAGLDPNFMKEYNYNLYQKWHQLFSQRSLEESYHIIKRDFKANYLYLNKNYRIALEHIESDPRFIKLFENDGAAIYHLQ